MGDLAALRGEISELTLRIVEADLNGQDYSGLLNKRNELACRIGELKLAQSNSKDLDTIIERPDVERRLKQTLVSRFPEHEKRVLELADFLISESKRAQREHLRGLV